MKEEITKLESSIAAAKKISKKKVDECIQLSLLYTESNLDDANKINNLAISEAKQIKYVEGEAKALLQAGVLASKIRNYKQASEYFNESLILREKLNDTEEIVVLLSKLGNAKLFEGKYSEALGHYNRAIEIRKENINELSTADLYSNSGIVHGLIGNYSLAFQSHMRALKTFEKVENDSRIASSCSNIGLIYIEQQKFDEALKMFQRALAIRQRENNLSDSCKVLNNMGYVYQEQKKHKEALPFHQKALVICETTGDKATLASTYNNLANVYKDLGKLKMSLDFYNKSLLLFQELNERRGITQSYINLGHLHFELNEYKKANKYLHEAIELGEQIGLKNQLRKAYEYLSLLYAKEEKFQEAYQYHVRYSILDKEILNTEISGQMAQMSMRHEVDQKEREADLERTKNAELSRAYNSLDIEKKRSEDLLLNILPEEISEELKKFGKTKARSFEMASVLFTDIKGFTTISEQLSAEELVSGIDEYFELFDNIVDKYSVEKIKTIGDAYLCVCGIPMTVENHAENIIRTAIDFLAGVNQIRKKRESKNQIAFDFRIGIHSGPVIAGVVGIKKFAYDIWGDTVNTAARMEQKSEPNRINISESTYLLIKEKFDCEYRGEIESKNKGKMKMYFVN